MAYRFHPRSSGAIPVRRRGDGPIAVEQPLNLDLKGQIDHVKNSRDSITVQTTYRLDDRHPDA
jgi:hypothetical protein